MNRGYHVTRRGVTGTTTKHYDTKIDVEGPWLVVTAADGGVPDLIVPAHNVIDVVPCTTPAACTGERRA